VKIIFFLVIVAVLVSGCVIGDGERDYAMSHITPTDAQSSLITPAKIPTPSIPTPPPLYWIKIDPISDKQQGDIFTANASTNLSVGDEILVQVYQTDGHTDIRHIEGEFYGIVSTVKVMPGRNEINTISFIVNSSELYPDPRKYSFYEAAINENATGEALFNITPRKSS
jgi:hypothetical protein